MVLRDEVWFLLEQKRLWVHNNHIIIHDIIKKNPVFLARCSITTVMESVQLNKIIQQSMSKADEKN